MGDFFEDDHKSVKLNQRKLTLDIRNDVGNQQRQRLSNAENLLQLQGENLLNEEEDQKKEQEQKARQEKRDQKIDEVKKNMPEPYDELKGRKRANSVRLKGHRGLNQGKEQEQEIDLEKLNEQELEEYMNVKRDLSILEPPAVEQKNIQEYMYHVAGKGFKPVKRSRHRIGFFGYVKNRLMLGVKWFFGFTLGILSGTAGALIYGTEKVFKEKQRMAKAQDKRDHENVPGRNGELFQNEIINKNADGEEMDILSDVRRGPLVWEKITAGEPEDPPEIVLMLAQGKRGSSVALDGKKMGHAMIGLNYSRYNKITKKKERYHLRMGFYPGANMQNLTTGAMVNTGAIVAGQLKDDFNTSYDVARRYQVKPGDINRVLKAAETYADRGYGAYKRNCTTFMVDMAKVANLPVAQDLKEQEMQFKGVGLWGVFAGGGVSNFGAFGAANEMTSRLDKDDKTYQNFGQKLYTKEDVNRYYRTAATITNIPKGYSPGQTGEDIRWRDDGELTASFEEHDELMLNELDGKMREVSEKLYNELVRRFPKKHMNAEDARAIGYIKLVDSMDLNGTFTHKAPSSEQLRGINRDFREILKELNNYYRIRLQKDAELNPFFMEFFSICEVAMSHVDVEYEKSLIKETKGDIGPLLFEYSYVNHKLAYRGADGKGKGCDISAGLYDGYLLSGKKPSEIVAQEFRLKQLEEKGEGERSEDEDKEYDNLMRDHKLAQDFACANRYYMRKEEYSDEEIRYAFHDLPVTERQVDQPGDTLAGAFEQGYMPSNMYQASILEKVFDGLSNIDYSQYAGDKEAAERIDSYLVEKAGQKSGLMRKILSAYIDGKNEQTAKDLARSFIDRFTLIYISPALERFKFLAPAMIEDSLMMKSGTLDYFEREISRLREG